jgi:hypothetical protein
LAPRHRDQRPHPVQGARRPCSLYGGVRRALREPDRAIWGGQQLRLLRRQQAVEPLPDPHVAAAPAR